jgi:Ni/Co efflux regulator RcnB
MELQMKKIIVFLAMSSCFMLGTSIAHADSDSSHGNMNDKMFKMDQKTLKAMDKDSDGKVTKEEFKNYTKMKDVTDFDVWDVDGNGDINAWEMKIVSQRNASEQKSGNSSGEVGNPTGAAGKSSTPSGS